MAYRIPNKNPIDIEQRVAVGVSIPFNVNDVFNKTYTTQDQIKSNIINYILTDKGERVFNPDFGSSLRRYVFENANLENSTLLQQTLKIELQTNFPNVQFNQINVTPNYDANTINISVVYTIYNGPENQINITI
jgi:phage baseplate assembly protein W